LAPIDVRFTPKADMGDRDLDVRFVPILLQKSAMTGRGGWRKTS
jgi:hypothetical protein